MLDLNWHTRSECKMFHVVGSNPGTVYYTDMKIFHNDLL